VRPTMTEMKEDARDSRRNGSMMRLKKRGLQS
jgi:hypothetical protein